MSIKSYGLRSIPSTLNTEIVFFTIYLNETLEGVKDPSNNLYYFNNAVGNMTTAGIDYILRGSLLSSPSAVGETNIISPLSVGNSDVLYGEFSLKRIDTYHFGWYKNTTQITTLNTSSNTGSFIPIFIVTSDNKALIYFYTPLTTWLNDNTKFSFSPATASKYGFVTSVTNQGTRGYVNMGTVARLTEVNNSTLIYNISEEYDPSTDPYEDGGNSGGSGGGDGGTGDFDNTSDTIPIPNLPSVTGLNTGFFTAFVCTPSEMQQLSNYLWNNVITDILNPSTQLGDKIDALKKVVANPYDAIMGCSLIPVTPSTGGSKEVKMYGILSTGLNFSYANSRWVSVDCGTLNINEYWGGYLDYSPYTKTTSLYLPYIGTVSIDIDLIMGKALQVVYHVDILTGICIAYILVNGSVEFQYQGQCSTQIPITNADYSGSIQSGIGLVGNIANIVTGGIAGSSGGIAGAVAGATSKAVSQTPAIAGNVMGMKPDIKSGGGVGSSGGILGVQKPYLIIERPRQSLPKGQNSFTGYPCNRTMKIGDCLGYTEIEDIKLDNIPLTDTEKEELLSILQKGVYFANE